ncbi:MAG: hypothetical protein AAF560_22685, partial [Acidobacteriota bacterium]
MLSFLPPSGADREIDRSLPARHSRVLGVSVLSVPAFDVPAFDVPVLGVGLGSSKPMRSLIVGVLALLFGLAPAFGQTTSERSFVASTSSSGSVNDCTLRVRSNENGTSNARFFRARPRSQQLTVWVDAGFTIPATYFDCQGNSINVPAGTTVTQYVDLILDVASCRLQADQGFAGDVSCCVEVRRSGALVAAASPLGTPGTISTGAECNAVHAIAADLKFV